MPTKNTIVAVFLLLVHTSLAAAELVAGPMPGHSAMRAVKLWLQTDSATEAGLRYWPLDEPDDVRETRTVETEAGRAFTAEIDVTGLEPGTRYGYLVLLDGMEQPAEFDQSFRTQPLWQWREDPPEFTFALGSCAYINEPAYDRPGEPYGGDYRVFDAIAGKNPAFMLWLGDNVYYREADWDSPSGMFSRYSHTRGLAEMQQLLVTTHHYATWDDHDFGPNDSDRSFALREHSLAVFEAFWPNPGFDAGPGGVTRRFEWHDAAFFLLDNRYFRSANGRTTGSRTILGRDQVEWLIDALKSSHASFKFVVMGGQFLNPAEVFETYAHLAPGERRAILDRIDAEDIPGIVFLSGDRHHSVLLKKERGVDYPLYDWTVSPLTAGTGRPAAGEGQYRVEGSLYTERAFGLARVSGPRDDRVLTLSLNDSDGSEVWRTEIRQRDLRP